MGTPSSNAPSQRPDRGRVSLRRSGRLHGLVHHPLFELLLTAVAVLALLGGLYVLTGNWPPMVVIESSSMQHGPDDHLGVINAGDMVLAEHVPVPSGVTTYVQGVASGYSTYGEAGDAIVYAPNGNAGATPVIHRAILWLDWDPAYHHFSASQLSGLQCHTSYLWYPGGNVTGGSGYCPSSPNSLLTGVLELEHVGWQGVMVVIDLRALENDSGHSGFLTMGDGNFVAGIGEYDQSGACQVGISCLVEPGWVLGVARGMVPWVGALKLVGSPEAGNVPSGSWAGLGGSIGVLLLLVIAGPRLYRRLRSEGPRGGGGRHAPEHWVEPEEGPAGGEGSASGGSTAEERGSRASAPDPSSDPNSNPNSIF